MKHPNKPIQTYDDSRELHNQDHFNIWYNQKERKGLLVNDVMAGGKTHSIGCENGFIHLIDKFQPNLHWGVIDVPRVENTTDPVLLSGLYKLGQHLKRPVVIETDYIRFREQLSVKTLQNNNFLIIKKRFSRKCIFALNSEKLRFRRFFRFFFYLNKY